MTPEEMSKRMAQRKIDEASKHYYNSMKSERNSHVAAKERDAAINKAIYGNYENRLMHPSTEAKKTQECPKGLRHY